MVVFPKTLLKTEIDIQKYRRFYFKIDKITEIRERNHDHLIYTLIVKNNHYLFIKI